MNILFFSRRFHPDVGGVEKHVLEISKRLVEKGHKVVVATEFPYKMPYVHYHEKIKGVEVYRLKAGKEDWFKKFRIWEELWSLRKLLKTAEVVHCHDVFFWYLPFRFLYPKKPVFTTFHGYESYPIRKRTIFIRKISEKLSWGNICIGDFIRKWYRTKPAYVSYGAVEIPNSQFPIPNKPKRESAVFVGRLDEQTGILTYFKAFEILKRKYPKFEFIVIGDGKYRKRIENKVKVLGFQKNPEEFLKNHRFAFVSRYLSILEALAVKRLVFAVYDNPVKEDYLKMAPFAPFIFIENSYQKIAEKITSILNNPEVEKQMIEEGYKWVQKQTWTKMVELYLNLWKMK